MSRKIYEITTVIDTREQKPVKIILDNKPDQNGIIFKDIITKMVKPLKDYKSVGDYEFIINGKKAPLIIERKENLDLISTWRNKNRRERFIRDLTHVRENGIEVYVIYNFSLHSVHHYYRVKLYNKIRQRKVREQALITSNLFMVQISDFFAEIGVKHICLGSEYLFKDIYRRLIKEHIIKNKDKY